MEEILSVGKSGKLIKKCSQSGKSLDICGTMFFLLTVQIAVALSQSIDLPSYGVSLEKISEGPNIRDLPTIVLKVPKIHPKLSFHLSIDTSQLHLEVEKIRDHDTKSQLKSLLESIDNLVATDKQRAKRGLLTGLINLFFGGNDNSDEVKKNAEAIEQTNKAVSVLDKKVTLLVDTERKDITSVEASVKTIGKALNNATSVLSSRIDALVQDANDIKNAQRATIALVELLAKLSISSIHYQTAKDKYDELVSLERSIRTCARIGQITEEMISQDKLEGLIEELNTHLVSKGTGLTVKFSGPRISYYYSAFGADVHEADDYYMITLKVPVVAVTGSVVWYKVHTWPVTTDNTPVGFTLRFDHDCVVVSTLDNTLSTSAPCPVDTSGTRVSKPLGIVLSRSSDGKCISALLDKSSQNIRKECKRDLKRVPSSDFSSQGVNSYQMHGSRRYKIICGGSSHKESECENCVVSVPCLCHLQTENSISPVSIFKCDKSEVSYVPPKSLMDITHPDVSDKIDVDLKLAKPVHASVPPSLNLHELDKNVAEVSKNHIDLDKALKSLDKEENIHLTRSSQLAHEAKVEADSPWSGSSLSMSVIEIILAVQLEVLTAYVILKFCLQNRAVASNITFSSIEIDTTVTTGLSTLNKVTIVISCVVGVLMLVIAVYPIIRKWYKRKTAVLGDDVHVLILSDPPRSFILENDFDMMFQAGHALQSGNISVEEDELLLTSAGFYKLLKRGPPEGLSLGNYGVLLVKPSV